MSKPIIENGLKASHESPKHYKYLIPTTLALLGIAGAVCAAEYYVVEPQKVIDVIVGVAATTLALGSLGLLMMGKGWLPNPWNNNKSK